MQLLETIKIHNRQIKNIAWHNQRFNRTRFELFGIKEPLALENIIQIPDDLSNEVYKCRIIYSEEIEKVEFEKYTPKNINSLKVVEYNEIDYSYKYYKRDKINELFQQRGNCDDILIVKNGLVTDTSFANVVFWDWEKWITPAQPLLAGTARARLLYSKEIFEAEIKADDIQKYTKARIINAMNELNDTVDIFNF